MSYPTVFYGPEGEQFNNYDARRWPLGTRMILQDGRRYAFAEAGGTTLLTGKVQQSEVPDPDHDSLPVVSGAQYARTINITNGSDVIEEDLYADGYAITEAVAGAGEGFMLKVDISHAELAASTTVALPLAAGYGLPLTLDTNDTITIIKNPYADVILSKATGGPTALILGVATSPIPTTEFGWIQTWGPAAVLVSDDSDDDFVLGGRVSPCGTAGDSDVGAMEPSGLIITSGDETTAQMTQLLELGYCMEVAPDTDYGAIFLTIS